MQEFRDVVSSIVSTLCGVRKGASSDEKSLCFLQLKTWLLSEGDDGEVLHDAKVLFARMWLDEQIDREIERLKSARSASSAADAIRELTDEEDDEFNKYFNSAFDRPNGFCRPNLALLNASSLSTREIQRRNSVIFYTNLCLRVSASGSKPIKGNAKKIYEYHVDVHPDCNLLRDIDPLMTRYRRRAAFLRAVEVTPTILALKKNRKSLLVSLRANSTAANAHAFKRFFARVAYVQAVIEHGDDVLSADILRWSKAKNSIPPKEIQAVTKEEFHAADQHFDKWVGKTRHQARGTNAGSVTR